MSASTAATNIVYKSPHYRPIARGALKTKTIGGPRRTFVKKRFTRRVFKRGGGYRSRVYRRRFYRRY